jgi:hypothetical protein
MKKIENSNIINLDDAKRDASINDIENIKSKQLYHKQKIDTINSVTDEIQSTFLIDNWTKYSNKLKIQNSELERLEAKNITILNNPNYFKELLSKRFYNNLSQDFKNIYHTSINIDLFHKICIDNNLQIISMNKKGLNNFVPIKFNI